MAFLDPGGELVGGTVHGERLGGHTVLGDHAQRTGGLGDPPEPVVVGERLPAQAGGAIEDVDHGGVRGSAQFGPGVEHVLDAMVEQGDQLVALTGGEFGHRPVHGGAGLGVGHEPFLTQTGFAASRHHVVETAVIGGGDDEGAGSGAVAADADQGAGNGRGGVRGEGPVDALPHPQTGRGERGGQGEGGHTQGEVPLEAPSPDHVAERPCRRGRREQHGGGDEGERDPGPDLGGRPTEVGLDHDPAGEDRDEQTEQGERPARRHDHPVAEQQQRAQRRRDEPGGDPVRRGAGTAGGQHEQLDGGGPGVGQLGPVQPRLQQPQARVQQEFEGPRHEQHQRHAQADSDADVDATAQVTEGQRHEHPGDQAQQPDEGDEGGGHGQGQSESPGGPSGGLGRHGHEPDQQQSEDRQECVHQGRPQAALGDRTGGHRHQRVGAGHPQAGRTVAQHLPGEQVGGQPGQGDATQQDHHDGGPGLAQGEGRQQRQHTHVGRDRAVGAHTDVGMRGQVQVPQVGGVARHRGQRAPGEQVAEEERAFGDDRDHGQPDDQHRTGLQDHPAQERVGVVGHPVLFLTGRDGHGLVPTRGVADRFAGEEAGDRVGELPGGHAVGEEGTDRAVGSATVASAAEPGLGQPERPAVDHGDRGRLVQRVGRLFDEQVQDHPQQ